MAKEKKNLKSFIEQEIKKTGFITEIDTIEELQKKRWTCLTPYYYFDKDNEKWRDLDILTYRISWGSGLDIGHKTDLP